MQLILLRPAALLYYIRWKHEVSSLFYTQNITKKTHKLACCWG